MIKLSHIISYLTCPRLAYYRFKFGERSFTEKNAVREIYQSLRRGFGIEWARERAKTMNENYSEEVFNQAVHKFKFSQALEEFRALDWDVVFNSEKFGITLTVDEIVEFKNDEYPLFVSLNAPKIGVWFQDLIRAGIISLVTVFDKIFLYYAYSGEIRIAESSFNLKRKALKLIERLKMIEKGFLPERNEGEYCKFCKFFDDCNRIPETFASKFL
ncbi:MAG: hypothetical protein RMH75_01430 [Archaeoglobaceae archaeon]|nr:hypothetical protein [Archaeoglobaceae archaeon]MDW7989322.1 hypothetical protein [Archaeoglobaceae archaeon]